jgi:polyketide synthase 12
LSPLVRSLVSTRARAVRRSAATPLADLSGRLASMGRAEQRALVVDLVRTHAATVLGYRDTEALSMDTPFKDLGFDSLTAVELRNRLSMVTGLRLAAAFVFRYPTPAAMAEFLEGELCPAQLDPLQPLLRDVDRLEEAIAGLRPEGEAGARLAKRLQSLLWRLGDSVADSGRSVSGEALESATDDEMFALIDQQLGSS